MVELVGLDFPDDGDADEELEALNKCKLNYKTSSHVTGKLK